MSGLTHFFAGVAAIGGLAVLLLVGRDDGGKQIALLVYGLGLIAVFFASAAYHLIPAGPRWLEALRKIDHSAIYVLIAGTYTPYICGQLEGGWRWGGLATIWGLAVAGIMAKMVMIKAPRWLTAGVYVAMGWLVLLMPREMVLALPAGAAVWLLLGGILFTIGAVIYIAKALDFVPGVFGFHEVWHIFVILGCLSHYIGILVYTAPAAGSF